MKRITSVQPVNPLVQPFGIAYGRFTDHEKMFGFECIRGWDQLKMYDLGLEQNRSWCDRAEVDTDWPIAKKEFSSGKVPLDHARQLPFVIESGPNESY